MKTWIKTTVIAAVLLLLAGTAFAWLQRRNGAPAMSYKTVALTRGPIVVTIDATGTLQPEEVVDVGAQVAGQIMAFGVDVDGKPVDYGSRVEQGTVLARIDEALAQADVAQAEAQLKSAQAGVRRAEADAEQLKAKFSQARRDWERAQKLGASEALAQVSYDTYQSAYEVAQAALAVGEAALQQAQAAVTQAETSLWRARRNLGYCTITSPVKGVVIDRRVNIGQTVVASLNAPSLFLIARDLKRMQLWVAVNEADVARIYPGQPVAFTVDALPDETFCGEVVKVRLNASMTQNVVTYIVEISTDNASGRLLPYLTANARFELARRDNVLLAPVAALRWKPSAEHIAPEFRGRAPEAAAPSNHDEGKASGVIHVAHGQYVRPVPVTVGIANGTDVEVQGEGIREGMEVVTGAQSAAVATETGNPFMPKLPRPPRRGGAPR